MASYLCGGGGKRKKVRRGFPSPESALGWTLPGTSLRALPTKNAACAAKKPSSACMGCWGTGVQQDELLTIYRSRALGGAAAERLHSRDRFLPSGSFQDEAVNPGLKYDGMKRERGGGPRREHVSAVATRRHPVSLPGPGGPGSGEQILKRREQQRPAKGNKQSHSGKVNGRVWPTGNHASGGSPEQGWAVHGGGQGGDHAAILGQAMGFTWFIEVIQC